MTTPDSNGGGGELGDNAGQIMAALLCGLVAFLTMAGIAEQLGGDRGTVDMMVVGTVAAIAALLASAARSSDPRLLAGGGSLPPAIASWAGVGALAPGGALLALAGWQFGLGFDGLAFVLGPLAGLALATLLVAPWLAGSGATTVAGFLGLRYGALPRLLAGIVALAVSCLVAVAGLAAAAGLVAATFSLPAALSLALVTAAALAITLPGGAASTGWAGFGLAVSALALVLATAGALATVHEGQALPQIGYGAALAAISGLERSMIEGGLANAQGMKAYAKPFLNLDTVGFAALVVSLAAGTAVLPQHLAPALGATGRREARSAAAATLLLAFLVAITLPALAAYAKRDLYQAIAARTPVSALPASWEAPSRRDLVRVHGLSLGLFEAVARAAAGGAGDPPAVAAALASERPALAGAWTRLREPARALVLEKARDPAAATPDTAWQAYRETLLPGLAALSGNKQALLTLPRSRSSPALRSWPSRRRRACPMCSRACSWRACSPPPSP